MKGEPFLPPYGWLALGAVPALLALAALPTAHPATVLPGAALGLAATGFLAGRRTGRVLRRAAGLSPFVLFLAAMECFRPAAPPGPAVFGATLPRGTTRALGLLLKTAAALCVGLAWGERVGAHGLARTLHRLRAPAALTTTTYLAANFLALLAREWRRVREAARARGSAAAPFRRRLRHLGGGAAAVLIRALGRGERIGRAMWARGYRGRLPPPLARSTPPGPREGALLLAAAALAALALRGGLP